MQTTVGGMMDQARALLQELVEAESLERYTPDSWKRWRAAYKAAVEYLAAPQVEQHPLAIPSDMVDTLRLLAGFGEGPMYFTHSHADAVLAALRAIDAVARLQAPAGQVEQHPTPVEQADEQIERRANELADQIWDNPVAILRTALQEGETRGIAIGERRAAKSICTLCAGGEMSEFQADPYPIFWHGANECEASAIWLAIRNGDTP